MKTVWEIRKMAYLQGERHSPDESRCHFHRHCRFRRPSRARERRCSRTYAATPVCSPGIIPKCVEGYIKEEITASRFVPRAKIRTFISERNESVYFSSLTLRNWVGDPCSDCIGSMKVLRVFLARLIRLHFRLSAS